MHLVIVLIESTTHIVVALNKIEVVALGTAEQDTAEEHTLLQLRQGAHLGQGEDEANRQRTRHRRESY